MNLLDETPEVEPLRFLLFAGYRYYPEGGIKDLQSVHATYEEAHDAFDESPADWDWHQIVEVTDEGLVEATRSRAFGS